MLRTCGLFVIFCGLFANVGFIIILIPPYIVEFHPNVVFIHHFPYCHYSLLTNTSVSEHDSKRQEIHNFV